MHIHFIPHWWWHTIASICMLVRLWNGNNRGRNEINNNNNNKIRNAFMNVHISRMYYAECHAKKLSNSKWETIVVRWSQQMASSIERLIFRTICSNHNIKYTWNRTIWCCSATNLRFLLIQRKYFLIHQTLNRIYFVHRKLPYAI